jgi:dTDP-4-dehydrorhamnose 3,5-epimerase
MLWVPPGFAHGFYVTSDYADFQYKCTDRYDPQSEVSIAWDDPDDWPSTGRWWTAGAVAVGQGCRSGLAFARGAEQALR